MINYIIADDLITQGAGGSPVKVLTQLSWFWFQQMKGWRFRALGIVMFYPISLKYIPKNLTGHNSTFLRVMYWCVTATKQTQPTMAQCSDAYMYSLEQIIVFFVCSRGWLHDMSGHSSESMIYFMKQSFNFVIYHLQNIGMKKAINCKTWIPLTQDTMELIKLSLTCPIHSRYFFQNETSVILMLIA